MSTAMSRIIPISSSAFDKIYKFFSPCIFSKGFNFFFPMSSFIRISSAQIFATSLVPTEVISLGTWLPYYFAFLANSFCEPDWYFSKQIPETRPMKKLWVYSNSMLRFTPLSSASIWASQKCYIFYKCRFYNLSFNEDSASNIF